MSFKKLGKSYTFKHSVSYVVNPNSFFVCLGDRDIKLIRKMENEIAACFTTNASNQSYEPKTNDLVAYYHPTWQRYIRAEVDFIVTDMANWQQTFLCWAVDYGVPLKTTVASNIKPLPEKFKSVDLLFFEVCLPLHPVTRYRYKDTSSVIRFLEWPNRYVGIFEDIVYGDDYTLKFVESDCGDGIMYGDMLLHSEETYEVSSLKDKLIDSKIAGPVKNFDLFKAEMCKNPQNRRQNIRCQNDSGVCFN